jgi:hypothetical protein
MGVVLGLTSRSNSSRRCVRDLSHQANHGYLPLFGGDFFTPIPLFLMTFITV